MDAVHRRPSEAQWSPAPAPGKQPSQRALLWGAVALVALLVLLTSLMSQHPDASWGAPGVRLALRLPDPVVYALVGLLALCVVAIFAVLFPWDVRFRRKKPDEFELYQEPQKVSPALIAALVLALLIPLGLIVYLYWGQWQPLGQEWGRQQDTPAAPVESLSRETPTEKPAADAPGLAWALFALATLAGLGIVGGGVWILFGERIERWWYGAPLEDEARQALLEAVEIGLDDLLREPDPRRAVIACYRRLEDVLRQHGLPRAPWHTPLEYLDAALQRFHLPAGRLRGLTTLFELAKFSAHPLGESEKRLAVAALREVKAALEEEGDHVPAA